MALEMTTKFKAITTSPRARGGGVDASQAGRKAADHIRYIDRGTAVSERASAGLDAATPAEVRAALRDKAKAAAERGGKLGARVLEKGIISLPNSWPAAARQDACHLIAEHLAPPGSDAAVLVVCHRDKSHNSHLHFAAVDGAESREAALARRPGAKRVRRKNVIGLSEGGRPKELRKELAAIINSIAVERGLEGVEWRSYKARGIDKEPSRHEGPRRRAIAEKMGVTIATVRQAAQAAREWLSSDNAMQPLDEVFGTPAARSAPRKAALSEPPDKSPSFSQQIPNSPLAPPAQDEREARQDRIKAAARRRLAKRGAHKGREAHSGPRKRPPSLDDR
jgi:hypothetical protein